MRQHEDYLTLLTIAFLSGRNPHCNHHSEVRKTVADILLLVHPARMQNLLQCPLKTEGYPNEENNK